MENDARVLSFFFEQGEKLSGFQDRNALVFLEAQQVLIAGDDEVRLGFDGAFEDAVVRIIGEDGNFGFGLDNICGIDDGGDGVRDFFPGETELVGSQDPDCFFEDFV